MSAEMALLKPKDLILTGFEERKKTLGVFVDLVALVGALAFAREFGRNNDYLVFEAGTDSAVCK